MSASSNPAEKAAFMNSETSWVKLGGDTCTFRVRKAKNLLQKEKMTFDNY
jgi:hypothetical protein